MVLLSVKDAPEGWELLRGAGTPSAEILNGLDKSKAASSAGPVLIFTSAEDPDALAAVKVLTALLKADFTRYEVHPVSGYAGLRQKFDVLAKGAQSVEPRAVLCVNCGAPVDLEHLLGLRDESGELLDETDIRLFVMDCHRPYHLRNIKSSRVVLFDDLEEFDTHALPLDVGWEDEWGIVAEDDSSDDESHSDESDGSDQSDDEQGSDEEHDKNDSNSGTTENGSVQPRKKQKRKRRNRRSAHDDVDSIAEDDVLFDDDKDPQESAEQDDNDSSSRKRKGRSSRKASKRARTGRRRASRYASYDGDEVDGEEEERERLREYYANTSLAMSSACLSHSIANVLRRANIDTLWMAILGVTSQYFSSSIAEELYEDARGYFQTQIPQLIPSDDGGDEHTSRVQNVGYASCNTNQVERIGQSVELRLDLLRHWSLHESLLYSTYTATRLASWRQTGKRQILEMLATLGIPLKESRQQWCYMHQKNKQALEKYLHKAVRRFDLGEGIQYDSFVRSLPGHKGDISAADYSHAITALLEFDDPRQRDHHRDPSKSLVDRFWRAYDALDLRRTTLLETGLETAISVQKLTADIAGDVIERRKFVPSGPFRYAFLRDQQCKEYLAQPLLLRRLALFLTKALVRQGAREKPFIVIAPDSVRKVWIAVAATTYGQRNDFGQRFRRAAERNGSQVTHDGFDSSVCEIRDGQEVEFVRFLHDVMR